MPAQLRAMQADGLNRVTKNLRQFINNTFQDGAKSTAFHISWRKSE